MLMAMNSLRQHSGPPVPVLGIDIGRVIISAVDPDGLHDTFLQGSDDEAMARIERNLESAWANGMVEMHLEPGPELDGAGTEIAVTHFSSAPPLHEEVAADSIERRVA